MPIASAKDLAVPAGAAISAGGGAISSAINITEAKRQRRFQREMSDTKHQREIRDLRKAGLNPILSVTKGMAGGSPSGASATTQNALAGAGELVSKGGVLKATVRNLNASSAKALQEADTSAALEGVHSAQSQKIRIENTRTGVTQPLFDEAGKLIPPAIRKTKKVFKKIKEKGKKYIDYEKGKFKFFKDMIFK